MKSHSRPGDLLNAAPECDNDPDLVEALCRLMHGQRVAGIGRETWDLVERMRCRGMDAGMIREHGAFSTMISSESRSGDGIVPATESGAEWGLCFQPVEQPCAAAADPLISRLLRNSAEGIVCAWAEPAYAVNSECVPCSSANPAQRLLSVGYSIDYPASLALRSATSVKRLRVSLLVLRRTRAAAVAAADRIAGWMSHRELGWLYSQSARLSSGSTWVEIGSYYGRSLLSVGLGLGCNSTLYSVDNGTEDATVATEACRTIRLRGIRLHLLKEDSLRVAVGLANQSCDVVFIDGDHAEQSVKADILAWRPKLKPGGLLAGHDYHRSHRGVMAAVDGVFHGAAQRVPRTSIWSLQM